MNTPLQRIFVYGNYINLYEGYPYFSSGQFLFQNAKSSSALRKLCSRHVCAVRLKFFIKCSSLEES